MRCNWKASSSSNSSRCEPASDNACAQFLSSLQQMLGKSMGMVESLGNQTQPQTICLPASSRCSRLWSTPSVCQAFGGPCKTFNSCIALQASAQAKPTTESQSSSASGLQEAAQQSQAAAVKLTYSVAERAVAAGISKLLDLCCSLP